MTIIPFPAKTSRLVDPVTGLSFLVANYIPPSYQVTVDIVPVSSVDEAYAALRKIRGQDRI